jgi:dCMP deaminase
MSNIELGFLRNYMIRVARAQITTAMFIGIAGPICSGKRTIAEYLIQHHNFTRLRLHHPSATGLSSIELGTPAQTPDEVQKLSNGLQSLGEHEVWFETMGEMVDFVTKRWKENFVTVDIWNEVDLELAIKRPFFLLISVDAPITIRWKRFQERSFIHHTRLI